MGDLKVVGSISKNDNTHRTIIKYEGTEQQPVPVKIILSERMAKKLKTYLNSILVSILTYAGEDNKEEVAYLRPRTLSEYDGTPSKLRIEIHGYKDEKYVMLKLLFDIADPVKIFLSMKEANSIASLL